MTEPIERMPLGSALVVLLQAKERHERMLKELTGQGQRGRADMASRALLNEHKRFIVAVDVIVDALTDLLTEERLDARR